MIINQKIRINLSDESALILDSQSRMCNKLYNMLLETVNKEYEEHKTHNLLKKRNLRDEVVNFKHTHPYLYSVHSSPLKNVAIRLKESFDRYFKSLKQDYKMNRPQYRSNKNKWFSLLYDEPNKGIKIDNKKIKISLGYKLDNNKKIRLYVEGDLEEKIRKNIKIKTYRITKELDRYYLIATLEVEFNSKKRNTSKRIAIDPNHTNFFVGIDNEGKSIELGKLSMIKYFDKQIDKVKSKRDKCVKKSQTFKTADGTEYYTSSKRYIRLSKTLTKLYLKRKQQIKQCLFEVSHFLCDDYDEIVIGDYTPTLDLAKYKTMHRAMLNQSPIGQFRQILGFVCAKRNVSFNVIDEKNTTRTCFNCGNIEQHEPNIREFICPCCQKHVYRDINSAINIGVKAKLLSSSDYVDLDVSKPMYTASYNYKNSYKLLELNK